jgi:hypothetical protein
MSGAWSRSQQELSAALRSSASAEYCAPSTLRSSIDSTRSGEAVFCRFAGGCSDDDGWPEGGADDSGSSGSVRELSGAVCELVGCDCEVPGCERAELVEGWDVCVLVVSLRGCIVFLDVESVRSDVLRLLANQDAICSSDRPSSEASAMRCCTLGLGSLAKASARRWASAAQMRRGRLAVLCSCEHGPGTSVVLLG